MMLKIKHSDGSTDNRFTFNREFMGHRHKTICVRFCGDFIGQSRDAATALDIAERYKAEMYIEADKAELIKWLQA